MLIAMAYRPKPSASQRTISVGFVVAMHLAMVWALLTMLDTTNVVPVLEEIQARLIAEQEETPEEAPPPKLEKPPPVYVPPVEIEIASSGASSTAIRAVTSDRVWPKSRSTNIRPPYPTESQQQRQEGTVTLALYVDEGGRVQQGRIEKSSGHPLLDESALKTALSRWRFSAGRLEGQPAAMWMKVAIEFRCVDRITHRDNCG